MSDSKRSLDDANYQPYEDSSEIINQVIKNLLVPTDNVPTNVSKAYNNEQNLSNEVQAYAKIAGKDWTFYVKHLKVSIGRNTDSHNPAKAEEPIDIDLGPSKVVSRRHALIHYNLSDRRWELFILGRNGLKVDGNRLNLPPNQAYKLSSGNIVDIGGTQMMFILPDALPSIANIFLEGLKNKKVKYEEKPFANEHYVNSQVKAFQIQDGMSSLSTKGSTVDQDYSKDEAKDLKPPYSYATMITQAILSNQQGILSLSEIYDWISSHFAYYRHTKQGWQNSIRHNLSLNKAFEKVPRKPNEPGKGMKWQISESYRKEFLKKWEEGSLNKVRRGTSVSRQLQLHLIKNNALPKGRSSILDMQNNITNINSMNNSEIHKETESKRHDYIVSDIPHHGLSEPVLHQINGPPLSKETHQFPQQSNFHNNKVVPGSSHDALNFITAAANMTNIKNDGENSNFSSPIKPIPITDIRVDYMRNEQKVSSGLVSNMNSNNVSEQNDLGHDNNENIENVMASPKKMISTLETMTPERMNNRPHLDPQSAQSHASVNSSPALWNYVQFSTPLGGTSSGNNGNNLNVGDAKMPKLELESPLRNRRSISKVGDLKDVDLVKGFKG